MVNHHILIAEDDLFLQQIYRASLEKLGYTVGVAANGRETLGKLAEGGWDLVLLDLNMPEVTGFDVLESMKRDGTIETIPVIVLTNFSEEEHGKRCLQIGAKAYYTKSNLSFEDILMQVKKLLKDRVVSEPKQAPVAASAKAATPDSAKAAPPAPAASPAPSASAGKKRVLVVEDDPFLSEIYKQNMEERGYDVSAAQSGRAALDILVKDAQWNIVLLDLLMPEMDGFTVLENLKAQGLSAKIPVMVLTNLSQENDQKKALELGAADFAIKSELSFDEIVARVESVMKKWQERSAPPSA